MIKVLEGKKLNPLAKETILDIVCSLGYVISESSLDDVKLGAYTDQDREQHNIIMNDDYTTKELNDILNGIYNTIFGTGEMCVTRSNKLNKIRREIGCNFSIIEVASILMYVKGRLRDEYNIFSIMSILTYWLDK